MGTTADKLALLKANKEAIRDAITEKIGEDAGEVMSTYAEKIMSIKSALVEKVQISVKTNQPTDNDVIGTVITVSYDVFSETYIWDGNPFEVSIPAYATYTITYGTIDGYLTPQTNEYTAEAGFIRTITAQYNTEVVTVIVSVDDNASVAGRIVTINGTSSTLTAAGVEERKIPYGVTYGVSVDAWKGYVKPAEQTYTANTPARTIYMQYKKLQLGVYIQDTTGKLWTESEWNGTATANCVAVSSSEHGLGVSLINTQSKLPMDTTASPDPLNLVGFTSAADAYGDYAGKSNTQSIVAAYGSSDSEAIGYCANYRSPNGKQGYLGSVGEWNLVFNNLSQINACLSKLGVNQIASGFYFWSSTRRLPDWAQYAMFYYITSSSGAWNHSAGNATWLQTRPFIEL